MHLNNTYKQNQSDNFRKNKNFLKNIQEFFHEIWTNLSFLCYNDMVMASFFTSKSIPLLSQYQKRTSFLLGKAQDL